MSKFDNSDPSYIIAVFGLVMSFGFFMASSTGITASKYCGPFVFNNPPNQQDFSIWGSKSSTYARQLRKLLKQNPYYINPET